ncbi:hypothetical protein MTR67_027783 [Solanum verrucosum]|uniref:Uncharacterized protein n=1 Tax=Solanum verrucosum TaxID=315347 RepID=A0AAF0R5B7_SOLVR|nr:hypothetical protein MTR67_027783 [Solanum verrucosum]
MCFRRIHAVCLEFIAWHLDSIGLFDRTFTLSLLQAGQVIPSSTATHMVQVRWPCSSSMWTIALREGTPKVIWLNNTYRDTTITSQNGAETCWLQPRICRASCGVFTLGLYRFLSDFLSEIVSMAIMIIVKQYYYLGEADLGLPLRSLQLFLTYITNACIRVGCLHHTMGVLSFYEPCVSQDALWIGLT